MYVCNYDKGTNIRCFNYAFIIDIFLLNHSNNFNYGDVSYLLKSLDNTSTHKHGLIHLYIIILIRHF